MTLFHRLKFFVQLSVELFHGLKFFVQLSVEFFTKPENIALFQNKKQKTGLLESSKNKK